MAPAKRTKARPKQKPPGWTGASADLAVLAEKFADLAHNTGDTANVAAALALTALSVSYWEVDTKALRRIATWARGRLRGNDLAELLGLPVGQPSDPRPASIVASFDRLVRVIELRDRATFDRTRVISTAEMLYRVASTIAHAFSGRPGVSLPEGLSAVASRAWIAENIVPRLPLDLTERIRRRDDAREIAEHVLRAKDDDARRSRLGFLARELGALDKRAKRARQA